MLEALAKKRIGLVDIDSKIPNLALMKLSVWHKSQGDSVAMVSPMFASSYDKEIILSPSAVMNVRKSGLMAYG